MGARRAQLGDAGLLAIKGSAVLPSEALRRAARAHCENMQQGCIYVKPTPPVGLGPAHSKAPWSQLTEFELSDLYPGGKILTLEAFSCSLNKHINFKCQRQTCKLSFLDDYGHSLACWAS